MVFIVPVRRGSDGSRRQPLVLRIVAAGDRRTDDERRHGEHRGEQRQSRCGDAPGSGTAPQAQQQRHGGQKAQRAEEQRAADPCEERSAGQRTCVVQNVRYDPEEPGDGARDQDAGAAEDT
jgi:hypothetical protein